MNNINATIIAGGMCKFGVRQASYLDMAQEAAKDCLDDLPGLTPKHVDGLLFASTFVGRRSMCRW
jgi:acetyl-CoA C-acetyltransferase